MTAELVPSTPSAAQEPMTALPGSEVGLMATQGFATAQVEPGAVPTVTEVVKDMVVEIG